MSVSRTAVGWIRGAGTTASWVGSFTALFGLAGWFGAGGVLTVFTTVVIVLSVVCFGVWLTSRAFVFADETRAGRGVERRSPAGTQRRLRLVVTDAPKPADADTPEPTGADPAGVAGGGTSSRVAA